MKRGLIIFILCAGLAAALRPMERNGAFQKANQMFVSWLSANTPEATSSPSITFLKLEEGDWSSWLPGPLDYATIFANLKEFSPPAVAVVPILDWEDTHPQHLSALSSNALEIQSLLLSIGLQVNPAVTIHDPALLSLFETLENVSGDISRLPHFTGIQSIPSEPVRRTRHLGHTYIDLSASGGTDPDVLRVPLLARYGDKVIPSFVLQAVLLKERLPLGLVTVKLGEYIQAGETLRIPIDASGHLAVSPDLKRQVPTLSAGVLLAGSNPDPSLLREGESVAAVETLRTNLVLIGSVGEGVRTFDRPGGGKITRAEIFAAAIATIQSGRFAVRLPEKMQFAVGAAATVFALLTVFFSGRKPSAIAGCLLGLLGIIIVSLLAFQSTRHWCPPTIPVAIVVLGAVVAFISAGKKIVPPAGESDV